LAHPNNENLSKSHNNNWTVEDSDTGEDSDIN